MEKVGCSAVAFFSGRVDESWVSYGSDLQGPPSTPEAGVE